MLKTGSQSLCKACIERSVFIDEMQLTTLAEDEMKVENLNIRRRESYDTDYPNMLVGIVQLGGHNGKMEVKLSNATVSSIFSLIKKDVEKTAQQNSLMAGDAIDDAANEAPLLEAF